MSKFKTASISAIAAAALSLGLATVSVPAAAQQQQQRFGSGVLNCDAPGGRQQAGAVIGGVVGALAGSQVSRNERALGAVAGGAAGAAAGSYNGCNQQRARAESQAGSAAQYQSTANLNIRSGPGTSYRTMGQLSAGQPFTAIGSEGEWVQIAGGGWVNARYVAPY